MLIGRFLFSLLLVFWIQSVYAQKFSYKNFNTDNGFPSSEVYSILQDKSGYMWFTTDHGVARYNGQEFIIYTTADGLVDNIIIRMAEDSKGRIWFVGHNSELCYWENGHISIPIFSTLLTQAFLSWETIQLFYIDKHDNLWVNGVSGIYRISTSGKGAIEKQMKVSDCHLPFKIIDDKKALYFYRRVAFPKQKDGRCIVKIGCEANDSVYYKTVLVDLNSNNTLPPSPVYSPLNKTLFFYVGKTLLAIPKNGEVTVKRFEENILDLSIDCRNDLWIGMRKGGVKYYKNADINAVPFTILDSCSVNSTFRDREGAVWISTLDKGIFYLPSTSILVYTNIHFLNDKIPFIGKAKNNLFVRTFKTELYSGVYSMTTQQVHIQKRLIDLQNQYGYFNSITQVGDSIHATYSGGIVIMTPDFKIIHAFEKKFNAGSKYLVGSDSTNLYYLYSTGVLLINKGNNVITIPKAVFKTTCAVFKDREILVGGKKGLYLFDGGKYTPLSYINSLLKKPITDMKVDQSGALWIATVNDGLLYFKNKKVIHYTKLNGLVSNICTSIAIDDQNTVWVGTTSGISHLTPAHGKNEWKIRNYSKKHGFNSNEITKLYCDNDSLWVGTMSGLSHAVISDISAPSPLCAVYIDSVKMNNTFVQPGNTSFSYYENNLKFEVSALTFVDQGNQLFRYRLIGLDTNWVEAKTNELIFNRLPSGNFRLEVQAANADMVWSQSTTYKFMIHKPFWLRWWFISVEVVTGIVSVYLIILFTVKRITRREKEKAHINKLLTEYQMKALTSQMNPHFIFNAINSIQNFVMLNDADIAYDYLEKFSRLIRMVLVNSEKKEITLHDELIAMELYVTLEQLRFENAFDYICEVDESVESKEVIIPALVIQPYIENAIWHGLMPLNKKGYIKLKITKQEDKLKIVLTDNGIGRKASDKIIKKIKSESHQSMGTNLTSSRIKLFGNDVTNSIEIIDNYNELDEASGTTVEILLPFIEKY